MPTILQSPTNADGGLHNVSHNIRRTGSQTREERDRPRGRNNSQGYSNRGQGGMCQYMEEVGAPFVVGLVGENPACRAVPHSDCRHHRTLHNPQTVQVRWSRRPR